MKRYLTLSILILFLFSCGQNVMEKKYDQENIFYDLEEMQPEKRKIIKAVHEQLQTSSKILGVDQSYIKSMKYADIYATVLDSLQEKKKETIKAANSILASELKSQLKDHISSFQEKERSQTRNKLIEFKSEIISDIKKFDSREYDDPSEIGLIINDGKLRFDLKQNIYLKDDLEYITNIFYLITFECYEPNLMGEDKFIRSLHYENGKTKIEVAGNESPETITVGNNLPCEKIGNIELVANTYELNQEKLNEKFPTKPYEEVELNSSAYDTLRKVYSSKIRSKVQDISPGEFIKYYPNNLDKIIQIQNILDSREDLYEKYLELKDMSSYLEIGKKSLRTIKDMGLNWVI